AMVAQRTQKGLCGVHHRADREVVESYYRAIQSRGTAEETIVGLFADDAVYIEPFSKGTVSGETTTHSGKAAIHDFFRGSWHARPPDMRLTLDTISIDGSFVRADWTCTADVFGSPMRGFDRYLIRDGRIARLE